MPIPVLVIPIAVGLLAQATKRFFNKNYYSSQTLTGIHLPRYGGMPSAHTAFAFSLLTITVLTEGLYSTLTAIVCVIAIFIVDDALRMRIFLEKQGQAISLLIKRLPAEQQKDFPALETRLGHKPIEVVAGAIFGVVLTLALAIII